MFRDSFKELNTTKIGNLIEILNPLIDAPAFEVATAKALGHPLSFYPSYQFIEIRQTRTNPSYKLNLILPMDHKKWTAQNVHILDGTNKPFYRLNKDLPINITVDNIFTYVKFFFEYVRGAQGKFQILDTIDDIDWHEEPAPAGKKALSKMITPLMITEENNENYVLKAAIIFKDSLFESDVVVGKNGLITLSNQKILVEDLPVIDSVLS